ncbi:MAG TPA: orotate phosphoribosyltransferase [Bacillota bacterium]|nr:orotate phosphoribosyltransferase [Bacillota bacterium]
MGNEPGCNDHLKEALEIFTESGALLDGHFLLTSGRHSDRYMQCAQVLKFPQYTEKLARWLAADFADDQIDLVIGPAMGGIIVAYETGRQLGVPAIFAERDSSGTMALRRGFSITPCQRVLVVEDVTTTGGSVREVMSLVEKSGGIVAGVGVLVDRSNGAIDFGVKQRAVITMEVLSWDAADCPLCRGGSEPVKPGSRK